MIIMADSSSRQRQRLWRGMTEDQVKTLDADEFLKLIKSNERRTLTRGLSHTQKKLLENLQNNDRVKTHSRDMVIVPEMLGKTIAVHNGKQFVDVRIELEMLGHRLGEFSHSRGRVSHQAPGIGATKSSSHMSVK